MNNSLSLVEAARARYDTGIKNKIRQKLFQSGINSAMKRKVPSISVFNILDFWGGGLFSDFVIDHILPSYKNIQLFEVEKDKTLHEDLFSYAQANTKNNIFVVPVRSLLSKFLKQTQEKFHFVWLDYCGTIIKKNSKNELAIKEDLELLDNHIFPWTTIAITLYRGHDSMIDSKLRSEVMDRIIQRSNCVHLPAFQRVWEKEYKENGSAMGTYLYKVSKKLW